MSSCMGLEWALSSKMWGDSKTGGRAPVPKRARSEFGACSRAVAELVGPSSARHAATASTPSSCIAATAPLVMNSATARVLLSCTSASEHSSVLTSRASTPTSCIATTGLLVMKSATTWKLVSGTSDCAYS